MLKIIANHHQSRSALELCVKPSQTMVSEEADSQPDGLSFTGIFRFVLIWFERKWSVAMK